MHARILSSTGLAASVLQMLDWPAAVLFDFDGVIVNSEPLHFQAFRDVLATRSISLSEQEYYRDLIGFDDKGAFQHIFKIRRLPLPPGLLDRFMEQKSQAMMDLIRRGEVSPLPGALPLIQSLAKRCQLAICSGALRQEIETILEGLELRQFFAVIVAAEDVTVGKPDPMGYLQAASLLGKKVHQTLKPTDCLVIEDAPSVIQSVRRAGFQVLGVATSYPFEMLGDAHWKVRTLEPAEVWRAIPALGMSG